VQHHSSIGFTGCYFFCSCIACTYMWFPSVPDLILLTLCQRYCPPASINVFATFVFCVSALPGMSTPVPTMLFWFRTHPARYLFSLLHCLPTALLYMYDSPLCLWIPTSLTIYIVVCVHTYIWLRTVTYLYIYTRILCGIVADSLLFPFFFFILLVFTYA